ncbi:MAG: glycosyltransferase [Candidatus Limnocylindria bacterium]
MAPLRVDILLAKSYDPDPRVRRTAHALIEAGHDVRVVAWDRSGRRPLDEDDAGIPIRRIHLRSRASRGWTQAFFLLVVAIRLVPVIRGRRPDVLHAVNLPMLAVAIGLAPFVGGRPRIVYDAFEIHSLMGAHRYPDWLVSVIGIIERFLPHFADLVITPGEDRKRYFERLRVSSISVPNWIDPPASVPSRSAARQRLGIEPDRFVVLYAGGIIGSRDLQPLIDHALRNPKDLVLIAGRGDAEDELSRAAAGAPNVRMLGWVPQPADLLAASDVLYYALKPDHPYAPHAAPNNLYQAVAYAIPLVYRAQGEIGVVAAEHRIGRTFHDFDSLEAALEALRDPVANDAVRAELRGLQDQYRWSRAARLLVEGYARSPPPLEAGADSGATVPTKPLLVLTRIWPTPERPSVGSFVMARVSRLDNVRVVRPRWLGVPRAMIYFVLLVDGLRVRGPLRGVEAHMLIPTGFVGLLIARIRGVPLVVYSHGGDVRDWRKLPVPWRYLSRFVAMHAEAIVTNSGDTAHHLRDLGRTAIVVPPGVRLEQFAPTPRPTARRILYLGGRTPRKGHEVAAGLADTLVGPGLRDVDPTEVPRLIAEHDVVLMPSTAEPFGLVAVEAIASGRWVVASDVGGLRDIIVDGVNGTLVGDGNFAAALEQVPEYDPYAIAQTVERFSLARWQSEMDRVWTTLGVEPLRRSA